MSKWTTIKEKFFGDRDFYKKVLFVAVPIMLQNGLTNFVGMLDNLMVGRVGTDQMSGVAIVNQLMFILYLSLFGGLAGAGIFTAQFYGKNDTRGIREVFRLKIIMAAVITAVGMAILYFCKQPLLQMFLNEGGDTGNIEATLQYAMGYMDIMIIGLIPFAISQCFASTLRECGETVAPMIASVVAVFVNLVFNYLLIFGKFGFPEMGVNGAAVATVISRFIETGLVILWVYRHKASQPFIIGLFQGFHIPADLARRVIISGLPLLFNEFLWSFGTTMQMQCYSERGLAAVAGLNICNTLNNVFNIVFIAMGDAIAIIVGQLLGAGKLKEARETDTRIITFSVLCSIVIGGIMLCFAPYFPELYNTTEEAKQLATAFIAVMAVMMPVCAFTHGTYFTLRSGGKTLLTFLFDGISMWGVAVPIAYVLSRFTDVHVIIMYAVVMSVEIGKAIVGYFMVKRGSWIQNLVNE